MPFHRQIPSLAAATLLLVFAAACEGNNSGPSEPALTNAQADSVAEVVTMDMDAEIDAATSTGASVGALSLSSPQLNGSFCMPTISPTPVVNTDGDRAPDSVRIEFAPCANTWGHHIDSISGSIDLIDPTPTVAGKNIRFEFNELRHKRVFRSGLFTSVSLDGSRAASRDSSVIEHSVTDFITAYVFRSGDSATHTRSWTSTFTADVEGSIQRDFRLPSGNWNITGTSEWVRGDRTHELSVTTDPQLHFNAECDQVPRFDSGTIEAVVTRNGATSTVTVEFTACGTYTVTRS
jgi:hypothetical protein